jgi:flagellar biosynthesis component FlhA
MLIKNVFLVLIIILIGAKGYMGQDKIQYVEIPQNAKLEDFLNKTVKISGKKPKFVSQHPILTNPFSEKKEIQSYLDTDFGQLVLISDKEIECPSEITLIGTLKHVSLGGKKNTKNSYENFECK